ncbi:MAG TPA: biopolymer transporter ExbD [bacterium (Candidatus Stahlbacteria)]|nr:biopolymer transporter ExbD [Candidatus Stahlbacteria bacterium]
MNLSPRLKVIGTFQFISLADIILILIIFFLLASTFIIQPGIKVDLPKALSPEREGEKNILITITKEGNLYLNQRLIDWKHFPSSLYREILKRPDPMIILYADASIPLQTAVRVLDVAKGAGAKRLLIATRAE